MRIDRLLCIEYFSSGGLAPDEPLPGNILSEAFAMLASICADYTSFFARKGQKAVHTFLDHRLKPYSYAIDAYISRFVKKRRTLDELIEKHIEKFDAALVIGPDGPALLNLVDLIEDSGVILLGPSVAMIERVSPKHQLYQRCQDLNVLNPPEYMVVPSVEEFAVFHSEIAPLLEEWQSPVIIKPDSSAGGDGLSVVMDDNERNLELAFNKAMEVDDSIIVQKMIQGESISVSAVGTEAKPTILSVNKQNISLGSPEEETHYQGGICPIPTDHLESIVNDLNILIADVDYRGYFGIDLIVNSSGYSIVDFNPRITTSYVGLREVSLMNPAQIMLDATRGYSPPSPPLEGVVQYGKVACSKVGLETSFDIFEVPGCITPPFAFTEEPTAFFTAVGNNEADAQKKFQNYSQQALDMLPLE